MIDGKFHAEYKWLGKDIVIDIYDAGEGVPNRYEIMAMYADGREIEIHRVNQIEHAEQIYNLMLRDYRESEKPLSGKYAKLREDLILAMKAGREAEDAYLSEHGGFDGGTCNFDSPALRLPRWKESLIEQAAKEAGSSVSVWNLYGNKKFVFEPNTHSQGAARSINAETMTKELKELGYDAFTYAQMD